MHLVLYKLVVAVEPKAFQSIPVECSAPGTGNPKQLFMNDGAKLLVGADDQGHDTAVEDELHHSLLIIGGVQVGLDRGGARGGQPHCRFYNNFGLRSTIYNPPKNLRSTIYRQNLAKIYNFCLKARKTSLQIYKIWATKKFNLQAFFSRIYNLQKVWPPPFMQKLDTEIS